MTGVMTGALTGVMTVLVGVVVFKLIIDFTPGMRLKLAQCCRFGFAHN